MLNSLARWTTAVMICGFVWLIPSYPAVATQSQTGGANQTQTSKPGSEGKEPPAKKAPPRSKDADKLNNERMSTRGLHKQGKNTDSENSGKQKGEAASSEQSTTKQDSPK